MEMRKWWKWVRGVVVGFRGTYAEVERLEVLDIPENKPPVRRKRNHNQKGAYGRKE
jgi:hypothetical protein